MQAAVLLEVEVADQVIAQRGHGQGQVPGLADLAPALLEPVQLVLDLADEVIARAQARVPDARFVAGDVMTVDVGADFDVVVSLEVLSHVEDQHAFLVRLRDWLRDGTRHTDIAGYLGNGRYVVIMPEADHTAAEAAIARMKEAGLATDAGFACFPADADNFDALYRAASSTLPPALRHAA